MTADFIAFKQMTPAAIAERLAAGNGVIRFNFVDAEQQPVFMFAALDAVQTDRFLQRATPEPASPPEPSANQRQLQHIADILRLNTGLDLSPEQLTAYLSHHRLWCLTQRQEPVFIIDVGPWYPDSRIPEVAHRRLCASLAAWLEAPPWPISDGDLTRMTQYFEPLWRRAHSVGIRNVFLS